MSNLLKDKENLFLKWDYKNDYIHENENKLLSKSEKELYEYGSPAYVLNTA